MEQQLLRAAVSKIIRLEHLLQQAQLGMVVEVVDELDPPPQNLGRSLPQIVEAEPVGALELAVEGPEGLGEGECVRALLLHALQIGARGRNGRVRQIDERSAEHLRVAGRGQMHRRRRHERSQGREVAECKVQGLLRG